MECFRIKKQNGSWIFLVIVFLMALLGGCVGRWWPDEVKVQPSSENTLQLNFSNDIPELDPATSYDTVSAAIIYQVYETLYEYDYLRRPYALKPLLAEDLPTVKNGGTQYFIKIKKNIQYYPDPAFGGKPRYVRAQDFINQIKRINFIPLNSGGQGLFAGRIKGLEKFRQFVGDNLEKLKTANVEGLTALNDHSLLIELEGAAPTLPFALAMAFTSPIPQEVIDYYQNDLSNHLVGTGPYYVAELNPKKGIFLRKNPYYREASYPIQGDRLANEWGWLADAGEKIPFIDQINFTYIPDTKQTWEMFLRQDLHILNLPQGHNQLVLTATGKLNPELKRKNIRLQISPTLTYWWLSFNMSHQIWGKHKKLRQAIAHAIDIEKLVQQQTNNTGQIANSIFIPGLVGYRPTKELPYSYNLERAKELLAAAGFPNGSKLPTLIFDLCDNSPNSVQLGEFIRTMLAAIGIKVEICANTFNEFLKKSNNGQLQFWYDGWALDFPDPENVLQLLSSKNFPPGPNVTYYKNRRVDEMIGQAIALGDSKEKEELLDKIEDQVNDDLPWIMLFYARKYLLYHSRLKNYRHSDIIYNHLKYLKLK